MKIFISFVFFVSMSLWVKAQEERITDLKCATPNFDQSHQAYEIWMQDVLQKQDQFANIKKTSAVYTLPVIFHIVHSGQSVGTGYNLSQSQISSQISVLNQAFRKTNTDLNTYVTQTTFLSAAADCQINFCAATVDPGGNLLTEPGIDRIKASDKSWVNPPYAFSYMNSVVQPGSIWDPARYLNIWIIAFSDNQTLGYAQFPTVPSATTPTIGDMNGQGGSATTDGVVLDYRYIGVGGSSFYNKGRVAVHEVGHWLGLWHIWGGDNACAGTDYVTDTPNAAGSRSVCPTTNGAVVMDQCTTTSPGINYQNYMDYSDDVCRVMFTAGQKARMQACMQYCTRRTSLASSTACSPVGIKETTSNIELNIYPNPTNEIIYVEVSSIDVQDINISIVNMLGQTVKEIKQIQSNGEKLKIDLSDKNKGIYFINVKSKSGSKVKRIVLQ